MKIILFFQLCNFQILNIFFKNFLRPFIWYEIIKLTCMIYFNQLTHMDLLKKKKKKKKITHGVIQNGVHME